jgi:hypothetical protein
MEFCIGTRVKVLLRVRLLSVLWSKVDGISHRPGLLCR